MTPFIIYTLIALCSGLYWAHSWIQFRRQAEANLKECRDEYNRMANEYLQWEWKHHNDTMTRQNEILGHHVFDIVPNPPEPVDIFKR